MTKFPFFRVLVVILSGFLFSCNSGPVERSFAGEALGTSYHIKYYFEEDIPLEEALDSIFERVNQSMSTYREGSDISRINRGDSLIEVDTLFRKVFELSEKVYKESGGYFDPTVGNLVNFYGFGPERGTTDIDTAKVDSLMQYVGLDKIALTREGLVKSTAPAVYLDRP